MMMLVTLFSKVLLQSTVYQLWLWMLWIYCPPGQAHEHGKALISDYGSLQRNRRRSLTQWCRGKICPYVVICLSEQLGVMASEWDGDFDMRTLDFYSLIRAKQQVHAPVQMLCVSFGFIHTEDHTGLRTRPSPNLSGECA